MDSGISHSLNTSSIQLQPKKFADYLSDQQDYALFLDIDGTLAEFTLDPKNSVIPNNTLVLLYKIQTCGVKVAIVTGRSLIEARKMLAPIRLPIAATHGLEIAFDSYAEDVINIGNNIYSDAHIGTEALASVKQAVTHACIDHPNFFIEDKPHSVALHYRNNPALAEVAHSIVNNIIKKHTNWGLKQGKYVWEMVPKGFDKGTAILTLLEHMQTNKEFCPIFIGDDITDEAGFRAVQGNYKIEENARFEVEPTENNNFPVKGIGIKVGSEPSCANYYVQSIEEVKVLLESFLAYSKRRAALSFKPADDKHVESKKIERLSR